MGQAPNPAYLQKIQANVDKLAKDPTNTELRTLILRQQVELTAEQLNATSTQAGQAVRAFTAAYATSKKVDPKALLDALTAEEQKILDYSKSSPTLYGVDLSTANKIASYLAIGSGVFLTIALVLFAIALFTIGPEAAVAIAAGEGVVATLSAALGTPILAFGGFAFLLSQFLGHLSSGIPMMTKQMIDNGSIGPGLRISALKEADDLEKKLTGTGAPGSFTASEFSSYANGIEAAGVSLIADPRQDAPIPYTRKDLAQLIIYLYGQEILNGRPATPSKLKPLLTPYLLRAGQAAPKQTVRAISVPTSAPAAPAKVFTGIVSQGTLGQGLTFDARPSDLIQTTDQLQAAAQNNLAAYLVALPSRIVYELKIVSSVTTKDGFVQRGTTQKVAIGTNKDGTTKYKNVVNRFATLALYFVNEKGSRSKITTLVLGPTDATTFNPSSSDLTTLEGNIQQDIHTTDVSDIQSVQTSSPLAVVVPTSQAATNSPVAGSDATTLYDWYTAKGQKLPTVAERSKIYEQYGLGSASLYTGTAEQNAKLLASLKGTTQPTAQTGYNSPINGPLTAVPTLSTNHYYNSGTNGTPAAPYGSDAANENKAYDAKIGALISNPSKRDIPADIVPRFYRSEISLEQFAAAVGASPDFNPDIGPQVRTS